MFLELISTTVAANRSAHVRTLSTNHFFRHRFHNVDEGGAPEAASDEVAARLAECVRAGEDVIVSEKLDGSLASPLLLPPLDATVVSYATAGRGEVDPLPPPPPPPRSRLAWALRTALSDEVATFVAESTSSSSSSADYEALAREALDGGATPLFEWCAPGGAVGVIEVLRSILDATTLVPSILSTLLEYFSPLFIVERR